jgi:hypothetical protein
LAQLYICGECNNLHDAVSWLQCAYDGLVKKYGPPSNVFIPINSISESNLPLKVNLAVSSWTIGNQKIVLLIERSGSEINPQLVYCDEPLRKAMEAAAKNSSSM